MTEHRGISEDPYHFSWAALDEAALGQMRWSDALRIVADGLLVEDCLIMSGGVFGPALSTFYCSDPAMHAPPGPLLRQFREAPLFGRTDHLLRMNEWFCLSAPDAAGQWVAVAARSGAMLRDNNQEPASDLARLLPHAQRAMRFHRALNRARAQGNMFGTILEQAKIGVVELDGQGRIRSLNAVATQLLSTGDALGVQERRLHTRHRRENALLNERIEQVLSADERGVQALSISNSTGGPAVGVLLLNSRAMQSEAGVHTQADATLTVLLHDRAQRAFLCPELLRASYGFTPAEARLATQLAAGGSLESIARMFSVSKETVRKHLRRLFAKTGTKRQSELVALLVSGIETFAPACDEPEAAC